MYVSVACYLTKIRLLRRRLNNNRYLCEDQYYRTMEKSLGKIKKITDLRSVWSNEALEIS